MDLRLNPHDSLDPETVQLLKARARRLAFNDKGSKAGKLAPGPGNAARVYLRFMMFEQWFGVPLLSVREVVSLKNIIPTPNAPQHLAGITKLRGQVIALVDLRKYWQADLPGHADSDQAIVVEHEELEFGILCREVEGLLDLTGIQVSATPQNLPAAMFECISGLLPPDMMLLDPGKLLKQKGFIVGAMEKRE